MNINEIIKGRPVSGSMFKELIYASEELCLVCRKCNKEWIEKRPKGYYVRYKKGNNYLVNRHFPDMIEYFKCPKCGNTKSIGRLNAGRKFCVKIRRD